MSPAVSTTVIYPPAGRLGALVPGESMDGAYTVTPWPLADATRYELRESVQGATWTAVATLASSSQAFTGKASGARAYGEAVRFGNTGVLGGSHRYVPPGKFELGLSGGLGAAAEVEIFEAGLTPGRLP